MFLNFSLKWAINLRRIMPGLEKLLRNQELITKELSSLKAEVNDLENLYYKLKNCCGNNSEKSLDEENAFLEKQINQTKQELIRLEVARGVKQVPLPTRDFSQVNTVESKPNNLNEQQLPKNDAQTDTAAQSIENKQNVKGGKKKSEKQENKKDKSNKPDTNNEASKEGPIDVSRLDMRVGKIIEVKKHPDADSLYVEQIDIGKDQPITVISGLVKQVPIEEMQGRMVIVLCNLKPVKMRGITSEGMVMCAVSGDSLNVLKPPEGAAPGDIVHVDGFPPNPDPVLNPKKKIFETVAPSLKTNNSCQATYNGHIWTIPGKGNVTAASLKDANIK